MKPVCVDLFCGLGGWSDGFLAEGWNCIGFDVERHDYGTCGYPGQLVLQDVLTLHGRQFRGAACIVASPPCQEFSYMAMPWTRAKQIARALRERPEGQCICPQKCDCQDYEKGLVSNLCPEHNLTPIADDGCTATLHLNGAHDGDSAFPEGYTGSRTIPQLTALFDACFRIQREASEAAGHHIPMVVENVKGAQPWVGRANANYGSFYLWGNVRSVGGRIVAAHRVEFGAPGVKAYRSGAKVPGMTWSGSDKPGYVGLAFNGEAARRLVDDGHKNGGGSRFAIGSPGQTNTGQNPDGRKVPMNFHEHEKTGKGRSFQSAAVEGPSGRFNSKSVARKAASAQIAKIPFELSSYIARSFYPDRLEATA